MAKVKKVLPLLNFMLTLRTAGWMALNKVPITNGVWTLNHDTTVLFKFGDTHYMYASYGRHWAIRKLLSNGKMGDVTDTGVWGRFIKETALYDIQHYAEGDKNFLHVVFDNNDWENYEILKGGIIGNIIKDVGHYEDYLYSLSLLTFSYTVNGKHFVFKHWQNRRVTIQELHQDGSMGAFIVSEKWNCLYKLGFTYNIGGRQFMFVKGDDCDYYYTNELYSNGNYGPNIGNAEWNGKHSQFTTFTMGKQPYILELRNDNTYGVYELLKDGRVGKKIVKDTWDCTRLLHPYNIGGRQFFYTLKDGHTWAIVEMAHSLPHTRH